MRKRLLASLGILLASTSLALSQPPVPPVMDGKIVPPPEKASPLVLPTIPQGGAPTPAPDAGPCGWTDCCAPACGKVDGPHLWGSAEYLFWWVKSVPVPLVTTGNPAAAAALALPLGALPTPGTLPLNSGQQNFGPLSGGRATVGFWLDPDRRFGVEGSGFLMESRTASVNAQSDANGSPVIAIPAVSTPPTTPTFQEGAQLFSLPGFAQGGVLFSSTVSLWGAEGNGVVSVLNKDWLRLDLLAGFRYIDLTERLEMGDSLTLLPPGPAINFLFRDHFATHNQIYAGQVGARAEATFGKVFVNLTGKVALGENHESIDVNGNTTIVAPPGVVFAPPTQLFNGGGFFAQGTNIGRRSRDEFVVVPEVRLQAGVNLTKSIQVFAGYEFMYMSRVVLPGDQIDRVINGSQGFSAPLIGPARPMPLFNSNDFWANGISAGIRFSF
jgi:Putative beta barrel porin-7 (BBP7)